MLSSPLGQVHKGELVLEFQECKSIIHPTDVASKWDSIRSRSHFRTSGLLQPQSPRDCSVGSNEHGVDQPTDIRNISDAMYGASNTSRRVPVTSALCNSGSEATRALGFGGSIKARIGTADGSLMGKEWQIRYVQPYFSCAGQCSVTWWSIA
jgi:hypothetical protein